MIKIAIANEKGGVGKTTSTVNIGAGLASLGKKVLLIDFDRQGSLTTWLNPESQKVELTVYDFITGNSNYQKIAKEVRPNLFLIPEFSRSILKADKELSDALEGPFLLKEALNKVKGFDYILIDSPPDLSPVLINALVAADQVYIPLRTEIFSEEGSINLIKDVQRAKKLNPDLVVGGAFLTFFVEHGKKQTPASVRSEQTATNAKKVFEDKLFKTRIRRSQALENAPDFGLTVFEYEPHIKTTGREDYLNLCKEIIKRNQK